MPYGPYRQTAQPSATNVNSAAYASRGRGRSRLVPVTAAGAELQPLLLDLAQRMRLLPFTLLDGEDSSEAERELLARKTVDLFQSF